MTSFPVSTTDFFAIAQFKKFNVLHVPSVQTWLDVYSEMCPIEEFRDRAGLCIMLLTAHFLELNWEEEGVTASNAVAIASGGAMSNRREITSVPSNMSLSDTFLSKTTYGQSFLLIRDFIKSGGFFSNVNEVIIVPPFLAWWRDGFLKLHISNPRSERRICRVGNGLT